MRCRRARHGAPPRHGGLGLGLAIVRPVMEMHGGRVAAESAGEGRGATLTVTPPLEAAQPAAVPAPAPGPGAEEKAAVRLGGVATLVVDDDPEPLSAVRVVLEWAAPGCGPPTRSTRRCACCAAGGPRSS